MKLKNKDMKHLKYVILMLLASCSLVACNSEDMDYDIDYTAIHPLGGQYIVTVSKDGADMGMMYCTIANTVSNDADKCWVRVGGVTAADVYNINGKINCDVKALSFSGSNIENLAGNVTSSNETFTLTDGKLELKGITAPSGTVADKISFTYTTSKDPGATYSVVGWRYTGWPEDDM